MFEDIKPIFENLSINVPFLTALKTMPRYAKYLKDICTHKRQNNTPRTAFYAEEVESLHQVNGIVKYKDPGKPTVMCEIGENFKGLALCDLGAGVSVFPYALYQKLGLTECAPSNRFLKLADGTLKPVRGILENVLVKVANFFYPVDFMLIDINDSLANSVPLILGRDFLATADATIKCRSGLMTMTYGELKAEVNIFHNKSPEVLHDVCNIDLGPTISSSSLEALSDEDFLDFCEQEFHVKSVPEHHPLLSEIEKLKNENCALHKRVKELETAQTQMSTKHKVDLSSLNLKLSEALAQSTFIASKSTPEASTSTSNSKMLNKKSKRKKKHKHSTSTIQPTSLIPPTHIRVKPTWIRKDELHLWTDISLDPTVTLTHTHFLSHHNTLFGSGMHAALTNLRVLSRKPPDPIIETCLGVA